MVTVIKATGEKEQFNEQKVLSSIRRARIPENIRQQVMQNIKGKLYEDIPTSEIYQNVLDSLYQSNPYAKSKYSLKESIMQLGPTGYPFEDFVSQILKALGYQTDVRQILPGKCVSHEVDVIAQKENRKSMIEAKFHNNPGIRSEIQVALYTHARFQDLRDKHIFDDAWIITNTKTTSDANTYAQCVGMKIISWSYPEEASLRDLIEKSKLHPVTILSTLSRAQKTALLNNHVVMCKEIHDNHALLDFAPLSTEEKNKTLAEITFICETEF